ncbi:hypothetical protein [Arthrobacter russicus]|uniref:IrrE N-terminal-like domain-containing protein n=1 Tax=Arthrobacter russicus TaxID=172040 RepID=A0ABU1JEW4_9MICC|nr:hypothetical protein [Arthrobacter russicus]MDR6270967.1 hypothetical protein [Arthrobacter russicus]
MAKASRSGRSPRAGAGRAVAPRPVDEFILRLALPPRPDFDDLSRAVEALYGRPLRFKEIHGAALHAATGIVFDAATFTGVMVPAEDSKYYSLLSRVHELCHLIIRSAPDVWFSPQLSRPRQPAQQSRLFLRICPRNSSESVDAETVREEKLVEQMARSLMRRLRVFADSPEEDHFA